LEPHKWTPGKDGLPEYVHTFGKLPDAQMSGHFVYTIELPEGAEAEAALQLAKRLLQDVGPRLALLNVLLCAYIATTQKGEWAVIPRKHVLEALGIRKRKDLSAEAKYALVEKAVERLGSIRLQIVRCKLRGETIERDKTFRPLWHLEQRQHETEQLAFPYAKTWEWELACSAGPWAEHFLWGERSLRQFAALPEIAFKLDLEHSPLVAGLFLHLVFHSRFSKNPEIHVRNEELLGFALPTEAELDPRKRYELRRKVIHASREQGRWGWEANFEMWPEELRPDRDRLPKDYWGEFLQCVTVFRPIPGSPAWAMMAANQRVRRGFLDAPPQAQALPEPEPKAEPAKSIEGGRDLRAVRQKLGFTQAEMAERLGIDRSLLSHIENGRRPLTDTVKAALEALLKAREEGEQ
jgi:DNA-binding XRE family transcriptional regulator